MTKNEALKLALEALELVNMEFVCNGAHHAKKDRHELGDDCPVTTRYQQAITAIKEVLAQSTSGDYAVGYSIGFGDGHSAREALAQPEQEPVAWRFTGIAGLKRYMTQKQYDAQTPKIKKWYEPFKCKNCTTPPQPGQEPVAWWNQKKDSVSIDPVHRHNSDCQPLYTAPPQPEPLIDEQVDDEFKLYALLVSTSGDKWLDMDAYDYFKAGFKAAHGIKE